MVTNSSNDRLLSDLPPQIFHNLISHRRAIANNNPAITDATTLRQQILSKLLRASNNADYAGNSSSSSGSGSGITMVREVVKLSPPTLLRILDPCLTYVECNRFLSRIHAECSVQSISALEMMHRNTQSILPALSCSDEGQNQLLGKISTGLPTLDGYLHGGLPIGSIAELVGRAGVGKTHLAQQLCVLAGSKSGGGAIYIDAEKKLSVSRLREIAFERLLEDQKRHDGVVQQQQRHAHELTDQLMGNVSVHRLFTTRELLDTLDRLEDEITLRNSQATAENSSGSITTRTRQIRLPVRVMVIDSIAAPIRRDFDMMGGSSSMNTAAHRASAIFQIAKKLKQLAHDYKLAVVVVNQVGSGNNNNSTALRGSDHLRRNNALDIRDGEFTASLGTAWQYCVTTRIVLEHEDDPHRLHRAGDAVVGSSSVRMATLAKSLVSKRTKLFFDLTNRGLCEVVVPA
mmetsp:Transcript_38460/g.80581  ORF Transcript_38460/g.80581 Transcript_38460/m.80581 type:complete len:459 (+) Transcript_38460:145-1521(+)